MKWNDDPRGQERTGSRDLGASAVMKIPDLRGMGCVLDIDCPSRGPEPVCYNCYLSVLLLEFDRSNNRDVKKYSQHVCAEASLVEGRPAFYVIHSFADTALAEVEKSGRRKFLERHEDEKLMVCRVSQGDFKGALYSLRDFVDLIEWRMVIHRCLKKT